MAHLVTEELARLPQFQRDAYDLIGRESLSVAETAEVMGTTPTAVKLRVHRALRGTAGRPWQEQAHSDAVARLLAAKASFRKRTAVIPWAAESARALGHRGRARRTHGTSDPRPS